jgi:hypothetical protein
VRKHIYSLTATLAAALMIAGASAASASVRSAPIVGATVGTTYAAGYTATGRDWRFVHATIQVPADSFVNAYPTLYPQEYVALSDGNLGLNVGAGSSTVEAGIETCAVAHNAGSNVNCPTGGWVAFASIYDNSLNAGPINTHYASLAGVSGGDGVAVDIYYNQGGNELFFTYQPPTPQGAAPVPPVTWKTQAYGDVFNRASVLDDFTDSYGKAPIAFPSILNDFRLNNFWGIAITTGNGQKGSMTGPWTTSPVVASTNGDVPPGGTEVAYPTALGSDGYSANGAVRGSDTFQVWAN